ncbi:hypothetical protein, partial [Idiomarina sp.]|uniref:hypothetical protein n=1 Tax=Idiomarina sp. TaxID=1874361 RepID=UPI002586A932
PCAQCARYGDVERLTGRTSRLWRDTDIPPCAQCARYGDVERLTRRRSRLGRDTDTARAHNAHATVMSNV